MSPSQQPCRSGRDAAKGPVVTTEPVTKNTFTFRRFARMQMTGAPYPVEEICHERDFLEEKTCELLLLAKDELREERVPPLLDAIFDAAAKEPTTIRIQQVQYPQLEEIDIEARRGSLDDTVLEPGSDWQNYKFREQCYVVAPRSEVCVAAPEYPRTRASCAVPIPHTHTPHTHTVAMAPDILPSPLSTPPPCPLICACVCARSRARVRVRLCVCEDATNPERSRYRAGRKWLKRDIGCVCVCVCQRK